MKPFPFMLMFCLLFADLPLNTIYYPTEANSKGLGVVLASYTWGGESSRLLGMPDEEIFEEMMEGMAKIHGKSFRLVPLNQYCNPLVAHHTEEIFVIREYDILQLCSRPVHERHGEALVSRSPSLGCSCGISCLSGLCLTNV